MSLKKEMSYREFINREHSLSHAPYSPEFAFYFAIKSGNLNKVKKMCEEESFTEKSGLGQLSDDLLRNMKYHLVITAAMVARFCIEGGMSHETAYTLSDFYILKADKCKSADQLSRIHKDMSLHYTQKMKVIRKSQVCSKPISKCIDYIYNNLHKKITVTELAQETGLNSSYLSRLFKKETGSTICSYIKKQKIETAKNMLKYSEYSSSQIASFLAFPTQSYFCEVFKKEVGFTPKQYQNHCYGKSDFKKSNLFS